MRHTCDDVEYGSLCEDPEYLEFEMKTILRQTKLGKDMLTGVSGDSVIITDGSPFTKRLEVYWGFKVCDRWRLGCIPTERRRICPIGRWKRMGQKGYVHERLEPRRQYFDGLFEGYAP